MKERLLGYLFFAIILAFAYNFTLDRVHQHFFAGSLAIQTYWYIPYVAAPAALLLGLAWWMGFYRKNSERLGDLLATASAALIIYLMLGAGYSCWHYCF
jgi:hypothetical protein